MPPDARLLYLVDTVVVAQADVERYLDALRTSAVPLYTGAGATLEFVRTTAADLGEPVEVQVAWSCADNVAWNEIRCRLVTDPRYYASAMELAGLRLHGTRRFHRDTAALGARR